jgi:small GTP-binding protein
MENKTYKTEIIKNKDSKFDFIIKVEFVGDSRVGKTSLLNKLINNEFNEEYSPTKGYEFNIYLIKVNDITIKFQIWDMSGAENYRTSLLLLYRNAILGFLVYSVCSRESFNNVENWIKKLRQKAPLAKIILLGNKCDKIDEREVSYEEGKEICEKYNLEYFMEISAKNDLKGLNFMEIGAIALYKEYENNGNEISGGILNESIMLNYSNASSKFKDPCC